MARAIFFLLLASLVTCGCTRSNEPVDLQALAGQARGGDSGAMKKLVELLAIDENQLNSRAYTIVIELGQPLVPALLAQVESDDKVQREYVNAALGTLRV